MPMAWSHLLGLPLAQALAHLDAAQAAYRLIETAAPQRDGAKGRAPEAQDAELTRRVIRVREAEGTVELTVSGFPDGEPKKV